MNQRTISNTIHKGIVFIAKAQQRNGAFLSLSSLDSTFKTDSKESRTTFFTSLILLALSEIKNEKTIKSISKKGTKFLLNQKSDTWSFNYWDRKSPQAKTDPYPDDLDDTFCALAAIHQREPNQINGKALAHIVSLLTSTEVQEGGPYNTWIVQPIPNELRDIDPAVNSNVAYFLSRLDISLPQLESYFDDTIRNKKYTSLYYISPYPILYFLSRVYKGKLAKKAIDYLLSLQNKKGFWENPQDTALAVCALIRFGYDVSKLKNAVQYLITNSSSWQAHPFYREKITKEGTTWSGSKELTAALSVEALTLYLQKIQTQRPDEANVRKNFIKNSIDESIKEDLNKLDPEFKAIVTEQLRKILASDTDEQIALLPLFFTQSIVHSKKKRITDQLLIELGKANVYGWLAYRIFDDFLDNEGNPQALSVATLCLRRLTSIYAAILSPQQYDCFRSIMDKLDTANTWEQTHLRLSIKKGTLTYSTLPTAINLERIAEKSLGHALGPITILLKLGYNKNSKEVSHLTAFFLHYIIARQLNDDAHDWLIDLEKGFLNPANINVLTHWNNEQRKKGQTIKKYTLTIADEKEKLQELFWYKTINTINAKIHRHTKEARKSLARISCIKDTRLFEALISPLEKAADKAIEESARMKEFLNTY